MEPIDPLSIPILHFFFFLGPLFIRNWAMPIVIGRLVSLDEVHGPTNLVSDRTTSHPNISIRLKLPPTLPITSDHDPTILELYQGDDLRLRLLAKITSVFTRNIPIRRENSAKLSASHLGHHHRPIPTCFPICLHHTAISIALHPRVPDLKQTTRGTPALNSILSQSKQIISVSNGFYLQKHNGDDCYRAPLIIPIDNRHFSPQGRTMRS